MESWICFSAPSVIACSHTRKLPWGDQRHSTLEVTLWALLNLVSANVPMLSHLPTNTPSFLLGCCASFAPAWVAPCPPAARATRASRQNIGFMSILRYGVRDLGRSGAHVFMSELH